MTETSLGQIENLAVVDHAISEAMEAGKAPTSRTIENRRHVFKWLEPLNVDASVVSGERAKGTFSSNGFPNRLKTPEQHRARVVGQD